MTKNYPGQLVFGLDIGTRSIVGTVGYKEGDRFVVVAQVSKEHETRSMMDGQIHDISVVGKTILSVKETLEGKLNRKLNDVCIAAAGRVLRTVQVHIDMQFEEEKEITAEDITSLTAAGVEKAYSEFIENANSMVKFYCVGFTVQRYFVNDYVIMNPEQHMTKKVGADMIATFLPDDVVNGLYKAVALAGLNVANLTLEPIAAIQVAIPQNFRMLNMALIDVGAGTSDICITKDGMITAYGMIPVAGDSITEEVAKICLVDFDTAEQIKRGICAKETYEYKDIMGLTKKAKRKEMLTQLHGAIESMARQAADKIRELNGNNPVSAVFVVGGGGKILGYTDMVAQFLEIPKERCAVRGEESLTKVDFLEKNVVKDSLLVTPIGICLSFYEQSNHFIYVTFNNTRVKLYDNNHLAVVDAAMQAEFDNELLFPRRGKALNYYVNGQRRMVRGKLGEAAVITVNNKPADMYTPIRKNDVVEVVESTYGEAASLSLGKIPEITSSIRVIVNDKTIILPAFAQVNGTLEPEFYELQDEDHVEIINYYTVEQIAKFMDVIIDTSMNIYVNNKLADLNTKVYDNFSVIWTMENLQLSDVDKIALPDTYEQLVEAEEAEEAENRKRLEKGEVQDASDLVTSRFVEETGGEMAENGVMERPAQRTVTQEELIRKETVQEKANHRKNDHKKGKRNMAHKRAEAVQSANSKLQETAGKAAGQITETVQTNANEETISNGRNQKAVAMTSNTVNNIEETEEAKKIRQQNEEKKRAVERMIAVVNQDPKALQEVLKPTTPQIISVWVNKNVVTLEGKVEYVFVDIFDKIDFDLTKPKGREIVTTINGHKAQFMEGIKTGDEIEVYWKD